jgi:hypothetical protein
MAPSTREIVRGDQTLVIVWRQYADVQSSLLESQRSARSLRHNRELTLTVLRFAKLVLYEVEWAFLELNICRLLDTLSTDALIGDRYRDAHSPGRG